MSEFTLGRRLSRRSLYRHVKRGLYRTLVRRWTGSRAALDRRIRAFLRGKRRSYLLRLVRQQSFALAVAGAFDDLPLLLDTLGARLVQEFPRLQAPAIDIRDRDVAFALTSADGIKEYFNCVLVERVKVVRGDFESTELLTLGDGLITKVRRENYSEADILLSPEFTVPKSIGPEYDTYFIITK